MRNGMKVLIAVDGSDYSIRVLDHTAGLPWPAGSQFLILSVAEMPAPVMAGPTPMPGTYYVEWEKALKDQADANAGGAIARFIEQRGRHDDVESKSIKGNTKEVILDEAERWEADLIMIGTHGYNTFERMWLGSVSRTIASHAHCSVEVVRNPREVAKETGMKIVAALDGSRFSDRVVAEIAERPWPAGTEIRLVTAIHLPFTPTPETWVLPDDYYAQAEKAGREQAEIFLKQAEERILASNAERSSPVAVGFSTILGHAEEVILSTAGEWKADLIILGSHGHRAWERFLLGSVSQAVAWHAPCSVEIVRIKSQA